MAVIRQDDSRHTVELTGKDLEAFLAKDNQFQIQAEEVEEDTIYLVADTDEEFHSIDDVHTWINEQEIIYYYRATEYLLEHDSSLRDSLSLAGEYGFEMHNISSETLATIHYQNWLSENITEK